MGSQTHFDSDESIDRDSRYTDDLSGIVMSSSWIPGAIKHSLPILQRRMDDLEPMIVSGPTEDSTIVVPDSITVDEPSDDPSIITFSSIITLSPIYI